MSSDPLLRFALQKSPLATPNNGFDPESARQNLQREREFKFLRFSAVGEHLLQPHMASKWPSAQTHPGDVRPLQRVSGIITRISGTRKMQGN
jgi:hypothetical protein